MRTNTFPARWLLTIALAPSLLALPAALQAADEHAAHHAADASPAPATQPAAASDKEIIAAQRPIYPLDTCVVSGEALGKMGKVPEIVVQQRLVRLCCTGCVKTVKADPAKYIAKLDAAVIAKQKPTYPLDTCVVSGEKLDDAGALNYVHAGRLVRFCCKDCVTEFKKDPAKYLAQIDAAAKTKTDAKDRAPAKSETPAHEGH